MLYHHIKSKIIKKSTVLYPTVKLCKAVLVGRVKNTTGVTFVL